MARPKSLGLPIAEMRQIGNEAGDWHIIMQLAAYGLIIDELIDDGELTREIAVFMFIDKYLGEVQEGRISIDEINAIMEKRTEIPSVRVPLWFIEVLGATFYKYIEANGNMTFGEAFKMEGRGQGKQRRVPELQRMIRDWKLCDSLIGIRADAEEKGEPISIEKACGELAQRLEKVGVKISEDVIRRAWHKHGKRVHRINRELLVGGTTS